MKNPTDFALKEDFKHLNSVGDKHCEISPLIIENHFVSVLGPYFNKTVF